MKEIVPFQIEHPGFGLQLRFFADGKIAMIPGTDVLADVTAGDPRSGCCSDRFRKLALPVFDGVISKASIRVDNKRFPDRSGGTGIDACAAASAETSCRSIRHQGLRCEQMTDQHPRPPLGVDHVAVFSDPTQAGFFRPGFVEQRCRINAGTPSTVRSLFR